MSDHYDTNGRRKPWRVDLVVMGAVTLLLWTGAFLLFGAKTSDINQSRRDVTYQACIETNERHDTTIAVLNSLISQQVKDHPEQEAQLTASKDFTVLLINALVPKRDCSVRVEELYG